MLKAGIYVDSENIVRCGGWNMRYEALRRYVEEQAATVVRANAYIAKDEDREENDAEHRAKRSGYRQALRHAGFKVVPKPVRYYTNADGVTTSKANADLDLAVDAMLQARNLDYVVIVSGDGDFTRLVQALQGYGCRVDVVGFHHTSKELRQAADFFRSGYLIPGLLTLEEGRHRGFLQTVDEAGYYGHLCRFVGHRPDEVADSVFLHGSELDEGRLSATDFAALRGPHKIIEFSIKDSAKGPEAVKAVRVLPPKSEPHAKEAR